MLANRAALQAFLKRLGVRPKKSLSQNFLVDAEAVRKLVSHVEPGDSVLEIGPGPGVITEALMERGAKVVAVELDRVFAKELTRFDGVDVREGDILDFDFASLPKGTKVVANIPYHLTAPILTRLVCFPENIASITVVVQEEMAERICASHGNRAYGSLTVYLNIYAKMRSLFSLPRTSFYPVPKVDSAVIELIPQEAPPIEDPEAFFAFVRTLFSQRRKMLRSTLKKHFGFESEMTERPEALSPSELLELYALVREAR